MKIICIGRNYAEHAKELNNEVPEAPVLFMKPKSALQLPEKPFYYPDFTTDLHYECEVVVKMQKNGRAISEKFAPRYYKEISVGLDFTARDLQTQQKKKGLPWEIAKAFDGSAVVGKFIELPNIEELNSLDFHLDINGNTVQKGNTQDMIYNVNQIIAYASRFFTLNMGDLIFTGTPAGVGPVAANDHLEGYLKGEKLFDVTVR